MDEARDIMGTNFHSVETLYQHFGYTQPTSDAELFRTTLGWSTDLLERSAQTHILSAVAPLSTGLFAQQLSAVHVQGICLPYGTGMSRTQYAYAALCALLLRPVSCNFAQHEATNTPGHEPAIFN